MTEAIVDGVRRYPANGVRIIVVGAGNGGLQAALECWRKGCEIEVLERAAKISAIGMLEVIDSSYSSLVDFVTR